MATAKTRGFIAPARVYSVHVQTCGNTWCTIEARRNLSMGRFRPCEFRDADRGYPMDLMGESKWKNKAALDKIVRRLIPDNGIAVTCPQCGLEWNRLTDNGICVN